MERELPVLVYTPSGPTFVPGIDADEYEVGAPLL
jgi:hypothetical protein